MTFSTSESGPRPMATPRMTMSRSEIIPTSRSPSVTGNRPTLRLIMASAASFNVSCGVQSCTSGVIASPTFMVHLAQQRIKPEEPAHGGSVPIGSKCSRCASGDQRQLDCSRFPIALEGGNGPIGQQQPVALALGYHELDLVHQELARFHAVIDLAGAIEKIGSDLHSFIEQLRRHVILEPG